MRDLRRPAHYGRQPLLRQLQRATAARPRSSRTAGLVNNAPRNHRFGPASLGIRRNWNRSDFGPTNFMPTGDRLQVITRQHSQNGRRLISPRSICGQLWGKENCVNTTDLPGLSKLKCRSKRRHAVEGAGAKDPAANDSSASSNRRLRLLLLVICLSKVCYLRREGKPIYSWR